MNKLQFTVPKQTTFNFGSKVNHSLGGTVTTNPTMSARPVAVSSIKFTATKTPVDANPQLRVPEPNPRT